jgi:hypothetical protein
MIARYLLTKDELISLTPAEVEPIETLAARVPTCATMFDFNYPDGLKPTPLPLDPKPNKSDALPKVDVAVITWTVDEAEALADIFTCPYHRPSRSSPTQNDWYEYDRNFQTKFKNQIRKGAPSIGICDNVNLLGSYFLCRVGTKKQLDYFFRTW